jgi:mRNA interferase RelE/StbE
MNKPYSIGFRHTAANDLKRIDRPVIERILSKLLWLARFVDTVHHEELTGQWIGYYRIRVGDYRIVYQLEYANRLIIVEAIGRRREIYKN